MWGPTKNRYWPGHTRWVTVVFIFIKKLTVFLFFIPVEADQSYSGQEIFRNNQQIFERGVRN